MALAPHTRLGHYEVMAPLGAGGMGEVYRARDARLNRDVAIKVLPDHLAQDPAALARFEREAQAVAALSHPNILAIFDFAHEQGKAYAVTELLEGQSLRDRLNGGGLPVRKAVEVATGLARGLAAAHDRGIVHRDLKPENVFLTTDGVVKILDFGLAKSVEPDRSQSVGNAETRAELTGEGTLLGTVGYMAPEQIRGLPLDARADLFALGAVLYEMLSGDRAFRRDTAADTMTAVLREDPPEFPPQRSIGPPLDRIVRHCLEKSPADRFQSARDVAFALDTLSATSSSSTRAVELAAGRGTVGATRERLIWGGVTVAIAALAAWLAFTRPVGEPARPLLLRASVPIPEGMAFRASLAPSRRLAVSPDGRRIAYVVGPVGPGATTLFIHSLAEGTATEVPSSDGAQAPFWSPDGQSLAFQQGERLMVVDAGGAPALRVAPPEGFSSAGPWGAGGHILIRGFAGSTQMRLGVLPPEGGQLLDVALPGDIGQLGLPSWLPDGERFLVPASSPTPAGAKVWRGNVTGAPWEPLFPFDLDRDSINLTYVDGWLVSGRNQTVVARRADANGVLQSDAAVPLSGPVVSDLRTFAFSVSPTVLVYQPISAAEMTRLTWYDRTGTQLSQLSDEALYSNLMLSPSGEQLLVAVGDPSSRLGDIWVLDIRRGSRARVTSDPSVDERSAVWTHDGGGIVHRGTNGDLFARPLGTGTPRPVVADGFSKDPLQFSPDGRLMIYRRSGGSTLNDIWVKPAEPEGEPRAFLATPANELDAVLSPDGRWMAYSSDESGRFEVYVTAFPSGAGKWAISTGGGTLPQWRADGRELFYISAERELMAVAVRPTRPSFDWDPPTTLFVTRAVPRPGSQYVVTPDGQRFLVNSTSSAGERQSLSIIVGWKALLPEP